MLTDQLLLTVDGSPHLAVREAYTPITGAFMNTNLSEIACIVDGSGSMDIIRSDAIDGFNSFITDQKAQPGQAKLTLVLFDDQYDVIHDAVDRPDVRSQRQHRPARCRWEHT